MAPALAAAVFHLFSVASAAGTSYILTAF